MNRSLALLFPWLATLLLAPQLAAEAAPAFKSMRVAALIEYLEDRGEACSGCVEKADFVRRCNELWERTASKASEKPRCPPRLPNRRLHLAPRTKSTHPSH